MPSPTTASTGSRRCGHHRRSTNTASAGTRTTSSCSSCRHHPAAVICGAPHSPAVPSRDDAAASMQLQLSIKVGSSERGGEAQAAVAVAARVRREEEDALEQLRRRRAGKLSRAHALREHAFHQVNAKLFQITCLNGRHNFRARLLADAAAAPVHPSVTIMPAFFLFSNYFPYLSIL
ncbi:unnamed protein product [Urochloa humidicola]